VKEWYVAQAKRHEYGLLKNNLNRMGIEYYDPHILVQKRGKRVRDPLFYTYLFLHFDLEKKGWAHIRYTPGLKNILLRDGSPGSVEDTVIEEIKQRVEKWNGEGNRARNLKSGDRVIIGNGPLKGLDAVFDDYIESNERCTIFLNFF
jgi:transcriptional antiterminator RfaH